MTQDREAAVLARYAQGAQAREEALCCPVSFDPRFLEVLPDEIVERDYGCGDPTPYVRRGDVVLDLGSGGGKVCWIAAQIAGPDGRVIGVDMNPDMLELARRHHATIAARVGFDTVTFHRAMIQDLRLDLDRLDRELRAEPVGGADAWLALREREARLRREHPLIADGSVDVVLSNCVLNLVRPEDKTALFAELYRVVKPGGRVAISDIVADADVPAEMQEDPELWSGCISGAMREERFVEAFADAGFLGVQIVKRDAAPWRTVGGIEFRALTVQAHKLDRGTGPDRGHQVVYHGPFHAVRDDGGQLFYRGARTAVGEAVFRRLGQEPFRSAFSRIDPAAAAERTGAADCGGGGCC